MPPVVVITSNRTRDVHDALKRRCLYHWVEHPDLDREVAIVRARAPEVPERLARQVAAAVEGLRDLGLYKPPGVAETIDWAQAIALLGRDELDAATASATLGTVVKYREDAERTRRHGHRRARHRGPSDGAERGHRRGDGARLRGGTAHGRGLGARRRDDRLPPGALGAVRLP